MFPCKKRAFTLLELLLVLAIVSVLFLLVFPAFTERSETSVDAFEKKLKAVAESVLSPFAESEVCGDFEENAIKINGVDVKLPSGYRLSSMVFPGKNVSAYSASKFCFSTRNPWVFGFVAEGGSEYYTIIILVPSGVVLTAHLKESEAETFKDKISKGRTTEWFSYYSY